MSPLHLLNKYFPDPSSRDLVTTHSRLVADKALRLGKALTPTTIDLQFVEEAALLHDIGVCRTNVTRLGGTGHHPYICHGILGREILEGEGLPRHALACERHIGVGLTEADIVIQELPLPLRDMSPVHLEERLVCFADLFFSKRPDECLQEKSVAQVRTELARHGHEKVVIFDRWLQEFGAVR